MSTDKLVENRFDDMLGQALRGHSESVPADFTSRMLKRIRETEAQKILAWIVLQERLALMGCIVLGGIVIVTATVFPDIVVALFRSIIISITMQGEALIDRIPQTIEAFSGKWQFYTVLGGVLGFAIYSFVELFSSNGLKVT